MPICSICGEDLSPGSRICHVCGTSLPETALGAQPSPVTIAPSSSPSVPECPSGRRVCPGCLQTYGPEFTDMFCPCGIELVEPPASPEVSTGAGVAKPPPGTPCLVLFGADKLPVCFIPLTKDATLIGRLDAVAGNFPDIDVTEFLEPALARKVSRKHALVLRSRVTQKFCLRPLAGNTGTQIENDMVSPLSDYPLNPGLRVILGGSVRMKFEIT